MNRSPKTPLACWALTALGLLAGCGAQAGNNGGATNWLECSKDSDCASNSCVERRCATLDAGPSASNTSDAATSSTERGRDEEVPASPSDSTSETNSAEPSPSSADASLAPDASPAPDASAPDPSARPLLLALGQQHACALFDDGTVWCWGNNDLGQLGDGSGESALHPVDTGLFDVVQLEAGRNHTCAMKVNGEVWCWGDDTGGQLAREDNDESELDPKPSVPVRAGFDPGEDWTLYAGGDATCVVERSTSHTVCWGTDPSGEVYEPTQLPQIARAFEHSAVNLTLTTNDFVFINYSHRVFRIADWSSDVVLDPDMGSASVAIAIDGEQQCRIKEDSSVWCRDSNGTYLWQPDLLGPNIALGNDFLCQGLGLRTQCSGNNPKVPQLPLELEGPSQTYGARANADHACAIGTDASIWCWGSRGVGDDAAPYQVHKATLETLTLQEEELGATTGDDYVNSIVAQRQKECRCADQDVATCYADTMHITTSGCIYALSWAFAPTCSTQQEWERATSSCEQEMVYPCALPDATPHYGLCFGESKRCPGSDVTFAGYQWCDGVAECPDGFDELNCVAASTYTCADNTTIDAAAVCDGQIDCADDSDELNCN